MKVGRFASVMRFFGVCCGRKTCSIECKREHFLRIFHINVLFLIGLKCDLDFFRSDVISSLRVDYDLGN